MHAHWTQVTEPGWKILGVEGGGSGYLDGGSWQGGTYCTVVSPDSADFSVILERLHCKRAGAVKLMLTHLPTAKPLVLWRTNEGGYFQRDTQALTVRGGELTLALEAASVYSLTSVATGSHGNFSEPVPPPSDFPLPHDDTVRATRGV